jgi:hypothetical protein
MKEDYRTDFQKMWDLRDNLGEDLLLEELMNNCDNHVEVILSLVKEGEKDSGENCVGDAVVWLKEANTFLSIDYYLKAKYFGLICPRIATTLEEKYELCEI